MNEDRDADNEGPSRRQQDQLEENRLRRLMTKVSEERRDEFWLRLGFDVHSDEFAKLKRTLMLPGDLGINVLDSNDVKEKKDALAWAAAAQKRSATFGTRMLTWTAATVGIVGGLVGILKYLQDWKGH